MTRELYTETFAREIAKRGGGPYRPANGTEGMMFDDLWCAHCLYAENDECGIPAMAAAFDIGEEDYPAEWCHDANGQPCCTAFKGMTMADAAEAAIARERGKVVAQ